MPVSTPMKILSSLLLPQRFNLNILPNLNLNFHITHNFNVNFELDVGYGLLIPAATFALSWGPWFYLSAHCRFYPYASSPQYNLHRLKVGSLQGVTAFTLLHAPDCGPLSLLFANYLKACLLGKSTLSTSTLFNQALYVQPTKLYYVSNIRSALLCCGTPTEGGQVQGAL